MTAAIAVRAPPTGPVVVRSTLRYGCGTVHCAGCATAMLVCCPGGCRPRAASMGGRTKTVAILLWNSAPPRSWQRLRWGASANAEARAFDQQSTPPSDCDACPSACCLESRAETIYPTTASRICGVNSHPIGWTKRQPVIKQRQTHALEKEDRMSAESEKEPRNRRTELGGELDPRVLILGESSVSCAFQLLLSTASDLLRLVPAKSYLLWRE